MLRNVTEGYGRLQRRWRKPAYESLKFYQDICEIRKFVCNITEPLKKLNLRLVSQMRDSSRSAKQNIREGYRKGTIGEFINSIKISLGSLEELSGDMEDCKEDGLISEKEFNEFSELFQSATYMAGQYLKSLYKMEREGTWKVPGARLRKKATLRNIPKPSVTLSNLQELAKLRKSNLTQPSR